MVAVAVLVGVAVAVGLEVAVAVLVAVAVGVGSRSVKFNTLSGFWNTLWPPAGKLGHQLTPLRVISIDKLFNCAVFSTQNVSLPPMVLSSKSMYHQSMILTLHFCQPPGLSLGSGFTSNMARTVSPSFSLRALSWK